MTREEKRASRLMAMCNKIAEPFWNNRHRLEDGVLILEFYRYRDTRRYTYCKRYPLIELAYCRHTILRVIVEQIYYALYVEFNDTRKMKLLWGI